MSKDHFTIFNETVAPGERRRLQLPVPEFYAGLPAQLPAQIIRAKKPGPRLFITSCIHGDEIIGVQIISRLMHSGILDNLIAGDIIMLPVVNIFGFLQQSRYLPDRRDLNRSFPGTESGSLASRLASFLMNEVVKHCTHGIDLHSGAQHRFNLPQVRINAEDKAALKLAKAFAAPVVLKAEIRDGSLRAAASRYDIPLLVYEGSEAHRFDHDAAETGWRGIARVLVALGMLPEMPDLAAPPSEIVDTSTWVRALRTGIFESSVVAGERVSKDQPIGAISDFFGETVATVTSPFTGMVIGYTLLPIVNEGDALFHITAHT